jgi:hypothetical protein
MATVRQKKPGVWEVRVFTGRDAKGRPTQLSRTVRGGKKDAERVAAELTVHRPARAAGRTIAELLDLWLDHNDDRWAVTTRRDQASRVELVKADPIAMFSAPPSPKPSDGVGCRSTSPRSRLLRRPSAPPGRR